MYKLTVLVLLPEFGLCVLWMVPVQSVMWSQWPLTGQVVWFFSDSTVEDSPHGCTTGLGFPKRDYQLTMVIQATYGISTQSLPWAWKHVGFHVKCPLLLSDFNQNWNVSINFRTPQYQIAWKTTQQFLSSYRWQERCTKTNRCFSFQL